jgi:hypothetical protein
MAHYAKVVDGVVKNVIVAEQDYIESLPDAAQWVQTSYNTRGNQHPDGRPLRANFAGIGHTYDAQADVFYAPQPFPSWTLNMSTYIWEPPVPSPNVPGQYASFAWDEASLTWVEQA